MIKLQWDLIKQHRKEMNYAFLRFKGFPKETLKQLAPQIVTDFAKMAQVPEEKVKIELLQVEPIIQSPRSLEI